MVTQRPDRVIFTVLAIGITVSSLFQSLVAPVLPTIRGELHTSQSAVAWVLTAHLLSASVFTPIAGRLGDMIGKRRVYVIALTALSLGALLAALAPGIRTLVVARVIQGMGAGVLPVAFGIVRERFGGRRAAGAVGALAALTAAGGGVGIVCAGPIVEGLGYRWLFLIPAILASGSAVAARLLVPESAERTRGRIDLLPVILLSGWLVALIVALSTGPNRGWGSLDVMGLLAAACVLGAAWIRVEASSARPLVDMALMRRPAVWTNNLVALLMGSAMYALFVFVPMFLQTPSSAGYGFGVGPTQSGLILLPQPVLMCTAGLAAGRLVRRFGGRCVVCGGLLVALVSVIQLVVAHGEVWELCVANATMGAGFGFAFAALSSLIVAAVPGSRTSAAAGVNANIRTVGGAVGVALMSSIVTAHARTGALPTARAYERGFAMLGVALAVAAAAVLLMPGMVSSRSGRRPARFAAPGADPAGAPTNEGG